MPPQISDDEESDVEVDEVETTTNVKATRSSSTSPVKATQAKDDVGEVEDDQEEEISDDEYIVESIVTHTFVKGGIKFQVKWEGYDQEEDLTWEDESNLQENASLILSQYYDKVGGRDAVMESNVPKLPKGTAKTKKHGRQSTDSAATNGKRQKKAEVALHPKDSSPPKSVEVQWQPPSGSWEDDVLSVDALEGTDNKIEVYLHWRNNRKSKHPVEVVYKRCPQKMLRYYESHLSFTPATRAHEATTDVVIASSKKAVGRPKKTE